MTQSSLSKPEAAEERTEQTIYRRKACNESLCFVALSDETAYYLAEGTITTTGLARRGGRGLHGKSAPRNKTPGRNVARSQTCLASFGELSMPTA